MSDIESLYDLSFDQVADLISAVGHEVSVVVEGDTGIGKSSLGAALRARHPEMKEYYFDATTKDLGDMMIPNMNKLQQDIVAFAVNEELGFHEEGPVILNLDEIGKANPAVQNGCNRILLERKLSSKTLPEGSLVLGTTNLGAEGLGDLFKPHSRNRVCFVRMRKPHAEEWIEWGINNDIDPTILGWVKDNPQLMQSFTDCYDDPDSNPYIYHPKAHRTSFVTPRSLHKASNIVKVRSKFDSDTLTAALIGTIGERGAKDFAAMLQLADQLPSLDSIKKTPDTAIVPKQAAAVCMVVYRALSTMELDWLDAWMTYMDRLDDEAQGMFANGVRSQKYSKRTMVMTHKKFGKWAVDHNYMFTADKT